MPGRGTGGAPCRPMESRSRDEDPDHLPGISASSVSVQSLMRKRTEPTARTTRFQSETRSKGTPPSPCQPHFLESAAAFGNSFRDRLISVMFSKAPGEARPLFTPNAGSEAGQGGCPPYWKPERETFSGGAARAVFSPKKWGGEGEPGNGHPPCALGCVSHLSRQYNNARELGNFQRGN